ncbi:MAG: hypothetical protein KJ645_04620 [Planctomycetes bacterium]|nr:hypothetical protein [Planctomycetota bacterium]
MKIHLLVLPVIEVQGHFTVYVRDKTNQKWEDWVCFHKERNLPDRYGDHIIDFEKEMKAGPHPAWVFHLLDLSGRMGYGLYEALIFTDHHVIFFSYIYDLCRSAQAWNDLERILASFTSDPEIVKRASISYDEGRTLGMDMYGLFLRLPDGWFPEKISTTGDYAMIKLPSGGMMEAAITKHIANGERGLISFLTREISQWKDVVEKTPCSVGKEGIDAFRSVTEGVKDSLPLTLIFGFHGEGGFGLALHSRDRDEKTLFDKVVARAVVMDPVKAKKWRDDALVQFKEGIKNHDLGKVKESLSVLELFSGCGNTAKALESGLKASEEIQVACAVSLGRMASKNAGTLLERCLKSERISETGRKACIRAMTMIGSPREKKSLEELQKKSPRYFSMETKEYLEESLSSFYQAQ